MGMVIIRNSGHCACPPPSAPTFHYSLFGYPKLNIFQPLEWLGVGLDESVHVEDRFSGHNWDRIFLYLRENYSANFGSMYTKMGMTKRRLAWLLIKDDTQLGKCSILKKNERELLQLYFLSLTRCEPPNMQL